MHKIIHDDCLNYLKRLPSKSIPLIITDPPYGLNIAASGKVGGGTHFKKKAWDVLPAQAYFEEMRRVSRNQIIWGGNYFTDYLPKSRCWLVWFKKQGLPRNSFADCELAWTSFDRNALVFNSRWAGFVKDSQERKEHPTQKSLEVMKWCVQEFSRAGTLILDPFAGSGSTGVAAKTLGRHSISIEKDRDYIAIARRRISSVKR